MHEDTGPSLKTTQFSVIYFKKMVFQLQSMDCVADGLDEECYLNNATELDWELNSNVKSRNVSQNPPFCKIKHNGNGWKNTMVCSKPTSEWVTSD